MRPAPRPRIDETDRLHGPEGERLATARGHHLDGQAALEVARLLERVRLDLLTREQLVDEPLVLLARQRQVQVIVATALSVARLAEGDRLVDRVARHDRRDGVVEGQRRIAGGLRERSGQPLPGQRPGGDDARLLWEGDCLFFAHLDVRMTRDAQRERPAERSAVHG